MKTLAVLMGLIALGFGPGIGAQTLLTNPGLSGSATAITTSSDYRYTRHSRSGSGRGGRSYIYYTWDPHMDQSTRLSLPAFLNGSSGNATAAGTFFAPTYSVTTSAATSLSSTASSAVFTTTYNAATKLNTPRVARQSVTLTAQAGGSFSFTLVDFTDVSVTATGNPNGVFRLFDPGVGVVLGPLYGPGTLRTNTSLAPGSYWIDSGLDYTASQDTLFNSFLNPGATSTSYSFSVTFTRGSGDSGNGDN